MKKDNKLMVIKSLIIAVFLILGNTALAQHPLLGPNELHVYAFPHQLQVTIGKQANDEGRTCYKWKGYFGENGIEERIGSKQVFDLPSYMSSAGSSYEFELTVIGEQYYQQTVELHIVEEITFQVQPKKGCFSGNEVPVKEDFEITTTPSGYENLVSIDYDRCHHLNGSDGHPNGLYEVFFKLVVSGVILDSHTVIIRNTDIPYQTKEYWIDPYGDAVRGLYKVVEIISRGFKIATGSGPEFDLPTIYGTMSKTEGYDCCDKAMRQVTVDINEMGFKFGFHGDFNAVPFLVVLRVGIRAGLQFEYGISDFHADLKRTCGPFPTELDMGYGAASLSGGAFIEDITGHILSATVDLVGKFSFDDLKMELDGSNAYTGGEFNAEIYLEGKAMLISYYQVKGKIPIWPRKGKHPFELKWNIENFFGTYHHN